jgi:hypothetical protein
MEYSVYVQDNFYKNISAIFVSDILRTITLDIHNNAVPNFDSSKPASIKIVPVVQ